MPPRTRARTSTPEVARIQRADLEHPTPDSLIRDVEPALGEEVLNIPIAQCETQIELHRALDHHRWELMTSVGDREHPSGYPLGSAAPSSRDNGSSPDQAGRGS